MPDVSLIVNTFQKPRHLSLVLESIALQRDVAGRIEVVVSDDGSTDETAAVVAAFAATVAFPVRFVSRPHDGFRLAAVRNRGARLARGDYLIFLDGDCILPADHVAAYLDRRRPGTALLGYCARLPEAQSRSILPGRLSTTDMDALVPAAERRLLARRDRKARWHTLLRHPSKPRLVGCNCGVWRSDFERVNGFDERFVGWGQEDDDFGLRLRAAGVRLESIVGRTFSLHVWHPVDGSATPRWRDGVNVAYFLRRGRITACRSGLMERSIRDVRWGVPDDLEATPLGRAIDSLLGEAPRARRGEPCEIELVVRPGRWRFTRPAECRLVIAAEGSSVESLLRRSAHRIVSIAEHDSQGLEALLASIS
jgi:glycosyltransferase involved in cell wall biosynthesis